MDNNPSIHICHDMKEHLIQLTNNHQQSLCRQVQRYIWTKGHSSQRYTTSASWKITQQTESRNHGCSNGLKNGSPWHNPTNPIFSTTNNHK
jgi:hypothetical protein